MKYILIVLLVVLSHSYTHAQNETINSFYNTYKKGENVVNVSLSRFLVQAGLAIALSRETKKELKALRPFLNHIGRVRILVADKGQLPKKALTTFTEKIKKDGFTSFIQLKEGTTAVDVLVHSTTKKRSKKEKKQISTFLLLIQEEKEAVVLTIKGKWDIRLVQDLLNFQSFSKLWAWQ